MLDWVLLTVVCAVTAFFWWRVVRLEKRLHRVRSRLRAIHDDTSSQHRALEVRLDKVLDYLEPDEGNNRAA